MVHWQRRRADDHWMWEAWPHHSCIEGTSLTPSKYADPIQDTGAYLQVTKWSGTGIFAELIHEKVNIRTLRSSSEPILDLPKYKLKTYEWNAFSVAVPTLWSKLSNEINISKSLNFFIICFIIVFLKHYANHKAVLCKLLHVEALINFSQCCVMLSWCLIEEVLGR